jgi:transposase-like protein
MLAVAEMYVKGVSTREVEAVLRQFGIEGLSSTQVSRAAKQLDAELEQWRNRPLVEVSYLILDARYERVRHNGIVRDVAVLWAIGVGPDERRRVLGVSVALSEAEVHWRAFLDSLVARSLRGAEFIVSDDHAGMRATRRAVFGGAKWQRCQFHLAQNAIATGVWQGKYFSPHRAPACHPCDNRRRPDPAAGCLGGLGGLSSERA